MLYVSFAGFSDADEPSFYQRTEDYEDAASL